MLDVCRRPMRRPLLLVLLVCVSVFLSCNSTDNKIAKDLREKVAADQQAGAARLEVKVDGGKVTLKGHVPTGSARSRVLEIAKTEPGVWSVDDQIIVDAVDGEAAATVNPTEQVSKIVIVPAGTTLTVRTNQALGSKTSKLGSVFTGSLIKPLSVRGNSVVPSGASVTGSVRQVKEGGLLKGAAVLELGLDSIKVRGHTYNLQAELLGAGGKSKQKGRNVDLPANSTVSFKLVQPLKVVVVVQQ